MTANRFTLWLTLYFLLVLNIPLTLQLYKIIANRESELSVGFLISLPFFFGALFYFLFSFITVRWLLKPLSIGLVSVSALVTYAMYSYGTLFDYSMVQNVFETNYGEASSYLSLSATSSFVLLGIVPAFVILRTRVIYKPILRECLYKGGAMLASLAVIGVIAALYFKDYSAFGRNNSYLNKMIIPVEYIAATIKYVNRNVLAQPLEYQTLGNDARLLASSKPRLTVLILGETARAQSFQLNGYARATNPSTSQLGVVAVQNVSACGTATALSVPCMFARMSKDNFDGRAVRYQDQLMDVLAHAQIDPLWLDTDGGCKGVCDRIETWNFTQDTDSEFCTNEFCDDHILLSELDRAIASRSTGDIVITLHTNGSHGPTYFERYDDKFRRFVPDCQRADIQNCSSDEIINTYDNTILHTDNLIAETIKKVRDQYPQYASRVVYISDHGESLGENGVYLHGMPYAIAPDEQTHVPWLLWFSDAAQRELAIDMNCLKTRAEQGGYSHDNLFDTMLSITGVETSIYQPELDLLSGCRG